MNAKVQAVIGAICGVTSGELAGRNAAWWLIGLFGLAAGWLVANAVDRARMAE